MAEDFENIEDDAIALDDAEDASEDSINVNLAAFVDKEYQRAKDYRYNDEVRWLKAYRNYRGIYGPDVQFTDTEKSRVFIKITKTKVLAAYGQIMEILTGTDEFPIDIQASKVPDGIAGDVSFDPQLPEEQRGEEALQSPYGFAGDGEELTAGATRTSLMDRLGNFTNKLRGVSGLQEGPGTTPTAVTYNPAEDAAKRMKKKIHDQLDETNASKKLRHSAFESALFGTGIMKGPFAEDKEYAKWDEDGEYNPLIKTVPKIDYVSIWNFYPDPDANCIEDCNFNVERHKLSRHKLRALKKRPFFRAQVIEDVIAQGANYTKEWWEDDLEDYGTEQQGIDRWEILEYWGMTDVAKLKEAGVDVPEGLDEFEEVQANIWVSGGRVLRAVLNPFKPVRLPYMAFPCELNPYGLFGIGVAENMEDTQILMNGFMRMAVDNAVLSGNMLIEIDETNLVPGQDLKVFPGKVFRRQGGAPGQAIFGTKFPNVSSENMMMFDKARQLADESTGIPSFSHGQTGVQGVGRTASGISMLMGAAGINVKTMVKNVDDYLLAPMGKSMFQFNMQFDYDKSIKGDLEVKAMGTDSLMAKEVRTQRLGQFLGTVSNPALLPFIKVQYLVEEYAKALSLDPDKAVNDMEEAALQAEILKKMGVGKEGQQQQEGGEVGTQAPAMPGMEGFSGTPQAQGGQDEQGQGAVPQQPQGSGQR